VKKSGLVLTVAIGLSCSGIFPVEAAETFSPMELPEIRQQRLELQQDFREKEEEIKAMGIEEQKYTDELKILDDEVALANQKIRDLYSAIDLSTRVVDQMEKDIDQLRVRISDREIIIKERLRTLQFQEGVGLYVDLLMDSKSLSQLFDVATAISTIMKADKDLIAKHQTDLQTMVDQEKELQKRILSLEDDQKEMQSLTAELQEKVEEKQRLLDALKKEKQESESELMDLYEVYVNLTAQEIAILKENQTRRVEYLNANPEDVFIIPAAGELTSGYGPRWGRLHAGIDIADASPDAKVVAAASGTVIRSYYSASYGNCVLITHKINGQTFTTLYAHLEKSTVTTGQTISKGEMLGYMGNTGDSRGKHLHFEIHEGQWNYEKTNSVDPLLYLKK
jgi:murein DD-endopeptidase MepM/ murein hydrolase activator NlpD